MEQRLYEDEAQEHQPDPDETPVRDRKLLTQTYDLNISSLITQIKDESLHLRPLSERPRFQRKYVWPNRLASLLIESILLNIPIPPCYFSQNDNYELDVIDGQQRIYSIYRFLENQFALSGLEVISEINGKRFHELNRKQQRQIKTHTLRTVIITNESHPEIQFDVFERLNKHTMPLNAQELRNCIHRGALNDLLGKLAEHEPWLSILGRKTPDKRLRDEELILRFFAFYVNGLDSYRTPQKHWLNDLAKEGRSYSEDRIGELGEVWKRAVSNCLIVFPPQDCFRRVDHDGKRRVINRALMDLVMTTMAGRDESLVQERKDNFLKQYRELFNDETFLDLISRAIDHKKRTLKRFEIWNDRLVTQVF
jgi:hypothetical protein